MNPPPRENKIKRKEKRIKENRAKKSYVCVLNTTSRASAAVFLQALITSIFKMPFTP